VAGSEITETDIFRSSIFNVQLADLDQWNLVALLLVIAIAASSVALSRQRKSLALMDQRRPAMLRAALQAGMAFLIAWGCSALHQPLVVWFHDTYGHEVQKFFEKPSVLSILQVPTEESGPNTAYMIAISVSVLWGAILAASFAFLWRRLRNLLDVERPGVPTSNATSKRALLLP